MNINLCNRNVDVLNCSLLYRLFVCSYLKAGAKHSQVFVDSRGTKFYSWKITGCQQDSFREIDFLLGNFFPFYFVIYCLIYAFSCSKFMLSLSLSFRNLFANLRCFLRIPAAYILAFAFWITIISNLIGGIIL